MDKYLLSKKRGVNIKEWLGYSIRPVQSTTLQSQRDNPGLPPLYTRADVRHTSALGLSSPLKRGIRHRISTSET